MRASTTGRIGAVALGAVSASIGLLPWWITGARLPLQNLWGTNSVDMPFALVPFSQYYVHAVAACFIVGAGIAGLIAGFVPAMRTRRWWVVLGVSGLQIVCTLQSALVTLLGLRGDSESQLYFGVILAFLALCILAAFATCALCSRPSGSAPSMGGASGAGSALNARWASPAWLIGVTLFLLFLGPWVLQWIEAQAPYAVTERVSAMTVWIAPVGIGIGIVAVGVHTAGRIATALAALGLMVTVPAGIVATSSVLGSRVVLKYWRDAPEYAWGVFRSYLGVTDLWLIPLVVAVAIALVGLTLRYVLSAHPKR